MGKGRNIKGLTVQIGGDTTGLQNALKNVNTQIRTTQSELRDINNLLKLDPTNTELLSQKQKALSDEINSTKEKLENLKTAEQQKDFSGTVRCFEKRDYRYGAKFEIT